MTSPTDTDGPTSKGWRLIYFLPLIVPIVVIATFFLFYRGFLLCSADNPCSPLSVAEILAGVSSSEQTRVAVYVARATWTLVNGVHLLSCFVAIGTAGVVIYHALESEYAPHVRLMIIMIAVALALDISLAAAWWTSGDVGSPAQQLLRATVGQKVPEINKYNRLAEALSLAGTLSLAAAACATLWQRNVSEALDETQVLKRVRLMRPILIVGACTLVIAILRLSVTHAWGASYLPPESTLAKNLASLITGIVGSMGTVYTLLMAAMYLPAALVLRARVMNVAIAQADPQKWLSDHGLDLSFSKILPRVIALLAPLLAGPLGDLLVRATKELGG